MTEEVDREKLALLEQEIEWLRSRSGTMEQLEKVCEVENTNIAVHSNELVHNLERRSLSSLATAMKDGTICGGCNDFATYLVYCLTATDKEKAGKKPETPAEEATEKKRQLRRLLAVEHMYCARNQNYVSELGMAALAIAYAVCSSRLVIEILGRIGPGGSYTLLKQWLKSHVGEPAMVPDGVVHVALDNEQRLVKNYLTRGDTKVRLDIFANILGIILPEPTVLNLRKDFQSTFWQVPSEESMVTALSVPTIESNAKASQILFEYLHSHLDVVKNLNKDPVERIIEEQKEKKETIQCPSCKSVYNIKVRNCKNAQCPVINIRAARGAEQGVSVEVHRPQRTRVSSQVVTWTSSVQDCRVTLTSTVQGQSVQQVPLSSPAKTKLIEPCFVNPSSRAAVKESMRHVGELASVTEYGGEKREWLALTCDGVS